MNNKRNLSSMQIRLHNPLMMAILHLEVQQQTDPHGPCVFLVYGTKQFAWLAAPTQAFSGVESSQNNGSKQLSFV